MNIASPQELGPKFIFRTNRVHFTTIDLNYRRKSPPSNKDFFKSIKTPAPVRTIHFHNLNHSNLSKLKSFRIHRSTAKVKPEECRPKPLTLSETLTKVKERRRSFDHHQSQTRRRISAIIPHSNPSELNLGGDINYLKNEIIDRLLGISLTKKHLL